MNKDWPRWIYHKTEEAHILNEPPIPEGWGTWDDIFGEQAKLDNLYETFSKAELFAYAESIGLDVDKRKSRENIIQLINTVK